MRSVANCRAVSRKACWSSVRWKSMRGAIISGASWPVKQATLRLSAGSRDKTHPMATALSYPRPLPEHAPAPQPARGLVAPAGGRDQALGRRPDLAGVRPGRHERAHAGRLHAGRRSPHRSICSSRPRRKRAISAFPPWRSSPRPIPTAKTPDAREAYNPDNLVCRAIRGREDGGERHRHRLRRGARSLQQRRPRRHRARRRTS